MYYSTDIQILDENVEPGITYVESQSELSTSVDTSVSAAANVLPEKNQVIVQKNKKRRTSSSTEQIKYEILEIRKEKEELERDILSLQKREKEIDLKIKEIEFSKLYSTN